MKEGNIVRVSFRNRAGLVSETFTACLDAIFEYPDHFCYLLFDGEQDNVIEVAKDIDADGPIVVDTGVAYG